MQLTKHHGLRNDFLIAFTDEVPPAGPALARLWCQRHTGIGADGLIFATPTDQADLAMTLFNADGSLAEISGNGIRCLAQAEARRRHVDQTVLEIDTPGGRRRLEVVPGPNSQTVLVRVDMGEVTSGPALPDTRDLREAAAGLVITDVQTGSAGNPHVVLHVENLDAVDVTRDGPALEAFWKPQGINVHFAEVSGPDQLTLRHWERGAGRTAACGSGATVSAALAHRRGLIGPEVRVVMPGGQATVEVGAQRCILTGPAVYIGDVSLEVPHG